MTRTIKLIKTALSFILITFCSEVNAQDKAGKLFTPPLDIPIYLAGNFGELRSNHFHAGIDIKTMGREGLKVLAVADGYVSRIKVSPFGYGLALYIQHPNGYTSLYGHLQKYNDEIQAYVRQQQYLRKSDKIELFPNSSQFPVKQGDVVAISGNSGGSHAPHLHFEIRETLSESPVDPFQFDFGIKDDVKPVLQKLYIYPYGNDSEVNGKTHRKAISFNGSNGSYVADPKYTIETHGEIAFGIQLFDQLNEVHNLCGAREVKLFRGNELIYHHVLDKVSFAETRYINAHTDFEAKKKSNTWIQRSYVLPNNRLGIYKLKNKGIVNIKAGETEHFRYEVGDFSGNVSIGSFEITGVGNRNIKPAVISQKSTKQFKFSQANTFESEDVLVYLPANILYEDIDFKFSKEDTIKNAVAPIYNIHDQYTPLHSYMALSIKLSGLNQKLRPFATIVSLDNVKGIVPEGGYWKGDYLIVKTRSFGPYTVMLDSIKPKLTAINIPSNKDMSKKWSIMIKAEDNLSGVHDYNSYIDGEWVLTEFDYKRNLLVHNFEDNLASGRHVFKMIVKDKIGNREEISFDFIR